MREEYTHGTLAKLTHCRILNDAPALQSMPRRRVSDLGVMLKLAVCVLHIAYGMDADDAAV